MAEETDDAFPLLLLTGRGSASQWHTGTRTAKSDVLRKLYPGALHVEVHPADAERLGLRAGQPVAVESRRGSARALTFPTPTVPRGQVFLPMHDAAINRVTFPDFDPYSRQPSYKACAVRLRALTDVAPRPAAPRPGGVLEAR
jgi:assimilatory nitrate reductase catalytic subunit